jgi:hypothetical protein
MLIFFFLAFYQPRRTLSPRRWKLLFNEEGCLDAAGMIKRVQRGVSYNFLQIHDQQLN